MKEASKAGREVTLLRRNRWRLLGMAWPLALTALGLFMLSMGDTSFVSFMILGLLLGVVSLSRAYDDNVEPGHVPASLVVEGGRLLLDEQSYELAKIRSGYMLPGEPPRIRLFTAERWRPIDVAFSSREEAEAALEDLDLSPRQRLASFRSFAPHSRGWRGVLQQLATIGPILACLIIYGHSDIFVPLLLLVGVATTMWRRRVHVGSDGVRLERGPFPDRFIPHERIAALTEEHTTKEKQVHLLLRVMDGDDARVGFHSQQEADAFVARFEAAAREARSGEPPLADALARGEDDPSDWIARLRAVTQLGAHRTAAIARDRLWTSLEGASVQPLQRAAAAVALGAQLDEGGRKRIADVAAATASPRLRIVLEQVTDGADDDRLAEALAELEDEEEARA